MNNESIKIAHFNIRSLISSDKRAIVSNFLTHIKPTFCCINETHLNGNNKINFANYNIERNDRVNRGGGGTMILIEQNVKYERLNLTKSKTFEMVGIKFLLDNNAIHLFSIYNPDDSNFGHKIFESINKKYDTNQIWCGDFNCHHKSWHSTRNNKNGIELKKISDCMNCDFKILFSDKPTCYVNPMGSFIDLFLINNRTYELIDKPRLSVETQISDHCPIILEFGGITAKQKPNKIIELFDKVDWRKYNQFVLKNMHAFKLPRNKNVTNFEIENLAINLKEVLLKANENFVEKISIPDHYSLISKQSRSILKEKRRLFRRKNRSNDTTTRNEINVQIRLLNNMFANSIKTDFSKQIQKNIDGIDNTKKLFLHLKRFSKYKCKQSAFEELYLTTEKNETITGDINIAEKLSEQFHNNHKLTIENHSQHENEVRESIARLASGGSCIVFDNNCSALVNTGEEKNELTISTGNQNMELLCSYDELLETIKKRNGKKSYGTDRTPMFVIKHWSHFLIMEVVILFNHCLANNYFPNTWKEAMVIPIPKAAKDNSIITNYRPISMLQSIAKLFEKKIETIIRKYLEENNLLYDMQFGFRAGMNTSHPLSLMQKQISNGLNRGETTSVVLLDIQSAFDTVWQDALISKMMKMGVNSNICTLTKSYLSERYFWVKYKNGTSTIKTIPSGTPQGSSLSPLLFLIFINDMPTSNRVTRLCFADDTCLLTTSKLPYSNTARLSWATEEIIEYFNSWKIKTNTNKTVFSTILGNWKDTKKEQRRAAKASPLRINGHQLLSQEKFKYLGVTFNQRNNALDHINETIEKSTKALGSITRILCGRRLSPGLKSNIYKAAIKPIMSYGCSAWTNTSSTSSHQMERFRKLERLWLRRVTNIKRNRGQFKYPNSASLYRRAKLERIDISLAKLSIAFYDRCKNSNKNVIRNMAGDENTNVKYKPPNELWILKNRKELMTGDKFLIFNKKKYKIGLAYTMTQ